MPELRIVVVSCPRRKPLQEIWEAVRAANWPDCPFPIDIMSPDPDVGWNRNLLEHLKTVPEELVLLMLDDNYMDWSSEYTANIQQVIDLMTKHADIALIKVQAGGAHAPEIPFAEWDRIREYDRNHHPFKRTNLIPAVYRRAWLQRLSSAVLQSCGPDRDKARGGAIEFEVTGTLLTKDPVAWPERIMGIHRPEPGGGGGHALLACIANDAVTGGQVRNLDSLRRWCVGVPGIEAFL